MANEILHPVDVVQPQGDGGNEPFQGDVNGEPKILLQEGTRQSSHRLGVLEVQAESTNRRYVGVRPQTRAQLGNPPPPRGRLPHPAGQGGLYVLPELGVLAGQVGEVGRLVLVAVARVHRLVERHGGSTAQPSPSGPHRSASRHAPRAAGTYQRRRAGGAVRGRSGEGSERCVGKPGGLIRSMGNGGGFCFVLFWFF